MICNGRTTRDHYEITIYIFHARPPSVHRYYEGITACAHTTRDYPLSGSLLASTGHDLQSAYMIHFVTFESMPIVNGQISAIYDNCKSRQRASGILCKCQRCAANDKHDRKSEAVFRANLWVSAWGKTRTKDTWYKKIIDINCRQICKKLKRHMKKKKKLLLSKNVKQELVPSFWQIGFLFVKNLHWKYKFHMFDIDKFKYARR